MSKREKRQKKILEKPPRSDIKFKDMHIFLIDFGFVQRNGTGSHRIYTHTNFSGFVNIQNNNGYVKQYQVRQIQKIIDEIQ